MTAIVLKGDYKYREYIAEKFREGILGFTQISEH